MSQKSQFSTRPISIAVSAATAALATPFAAVAQDGNAGIGIEEIIVTARKRAENLQNIPSSIQAFSESTLKEMGAQNMEDYARFIPSVTVQNYSSAGSNSVVFRGITTGGGDFIAQAGASVYLDETSVTSTGSQPNIRMMDINRVEALSGPQGTLFGASAQAGTLRIHTNQPDTSKFEAILDANSFGGSESDRSYDAIGVLNFPVIENKFAIRIAVERGEDGGYVDNILGHTPDTASDALYGNLPDEIGSIDNSNVAEDNWNSAEFTNARISARWEINDDWSVTLAHQYSKTESNADNEYNPFVGDLETIQFNKNYREDEWDLSSLTIEGDLGWAQFVSSTSFFDRTYTYSTDGTVYFKYYNAWGCSFRADQSYYYWTFPDPQRPGVGVYYAKYCLGATAESDWTGLVEGPEYQDKFSQEFRLSHQGEKLDWLVGFYYEDSNDDWDSIWMKPGANTPDFQDSFAMLYWRTIYTDPADAALLDQARFGLFTTDSTHWEQNAIYGEATWHINEKWDLTLGGRYFERTNEKLYLAYQLGGGDLNSPYGLFLKPEFSPELEAGRPAKGDDKDFVPKVSLSYQIDDDKMIYATYTEGFRPGGSNRSRGDVVDSSGNCSSSTRSSNVTGEPTCSLFPRNYDSDNVSNTEIGIKSRWANNTFQFNASVFNMKWTDFQLELLDPSRFRCSDSRALDEPYCNQLWQKVVANVGDAHTTGLQVDVAWVPAEGWDLGANAMWIEAEVDDDFTVASYDYGEIKDGMKLPNTPEFKASLFASYSWPVEFVPGAEMVLRGQYSYTGDSQNIMVPAGEDGANPSFNQADYAIADARLALISHQGGWEVDLFINNITDERAQVYQSTGNFEWGFSNSNEYSNFHRTFTNRPREWGVRFTQRWGD